MIKCYQCGKEANDEHFIPIEMYNGVNGVDLIHFCNDCWLEQEVYVDYVESYEDYDLESFI